MTNEQWYLLVLKKARRPGDQTLLALLEDEWRELLQSLENSPFHPWFLEKTSSGLVTVADTTTINVPTDFLLLVEDTKPKIIDDEDNPTRLKRRFHEDIEEHNDENPAGLPEVYDIFAGKIYFSPIPDDAYAVEIKYYQKSTVSSVSNQDQVSNLWILNAEEYVTTLVAHRLCETYTLDTKRADSLAKRAGEIRQEMWKFNEAKKHQDMDYSIER